MSEQSFNGKSRIHIQKRIEEADVTINVFGNDPAETYELYLQFAKMVTGEPRRRTTQAQRELANAELKANLIAQQQAQAKEPEPVNIPKCQYCNANEMKLIRWTDKATGKPKQAWKCQNCKQWWRP